MAHQFVDATTQDVVRTVRDLSGGGVDHAFEVVGRSDTIRQAWDVLRPGATAVVVGLTAESPWRKHVVYGDLIRAVDGVEVSHPHVVLDAIRAAKRGSTLELEIVRAGAITTVEVPVSRRAQQMSSVYIPLIYSYERERDTTEVSALIGIFRWRSTPAAWDVRLLWFFSFGGGDSNRLEAVER